MEKYRYPMLLLDVLGVTESELAAAEGPSGFFARRLRVMVLQSLSQAVEIMTLQGDVAASLFPHAQRLTSPLLQCIGFCEKLGFRRKAMLFMDKVGVRRGNDAAGAVRGVAAPLVHLLRHLQHAHRLPLPDVGVGYTSERRPDGEGVSKPLGFMQAARRRMEGVESSSDGALQRHVLTCLCGGRESRAAASWSSLAYHLLQNMTQCVRVLGFTDLRIEHILLLLCCHCNYLSAETATVDQLLGELLDISAGIEDYHVIVDVDWHVEHGAAPDPSAGHPGGLSGPGQRGGAVGVAAE